MLVGITWFSFYFAMRIGVQEASTSAGTPITDISGIDTIFYL
jgi:hypothetical protein